MVWPRAEALVTGRFVLEPLTVDHADEMVAVLAPGELYAFTGGQPPSKDALRDRYQRQAAGQSSTGDAGWLNWIIRRLTTGNALGYIQATIARERTTLVADLAWVVAPAAQREGAATECAAAVLGWLGSQQVQLVRALIHPDHLASARVAERLGLVPTASIVDGENVWEKRLPARQA